MAGQERAFRTIATALATTAAAGLATAAIYRHDHFGSNAFDLGIFDQSVWGFSRFELIHNTVNGLPTLGNHFQPILVTLAPLYWLWDDVRVLLIAQALLLAAGSIPLLLWARRRLGPWPALAFQAAYLGFWGLIGGDLFDFHQVAFAAPIVSLALYAVLTRRDRLLLLCTVLAFMTKEDLPLTFAAIGLYVAAAQRRWRLGLPLAAVSIGWFFLLVDVILPAIAGRPYVEWFYPALGPGPGSAVAHVVEHPIGTVRLFFTPRAKDVALFNLFVPWLLLPLLSPLAIIALPTLGERFFSDRPDYWAQGFHYSIVLAPILGFAAVEGAARLRARFGGRTRLLAAPALAGAVLASGLYFTFGRLEPLAELQRYAAPAQIAGIEGCLRTIPPGESVAATSALVPHLTHRRRIYLVDTMRPPRTRYLALDAATWTFPLTPRRVGLLVERELASGYGVRCSRAATAVLERGLRNRRISPELSALVATR